MVYIYMYIHNMISLMHIHVDGLFIFQVSIFPSGEIHFVYKEVSILYVCICAHFAYMYMCILYIYTLTILYSLGYRLHCMCSRCVKAHSAFSL